MNLVIPPLLFYIVGAAFVIGGALRAATLGRRHRDREVEEETAARTKLRRRHFAMGLIWIGLGLFLIASTAGVLSFRH
jgi:hypothetical protein